MFWLVENKEQLQQLRDKNFKKVFIEPIWSNENQHPSCSGIQGFYIREINYKKGFIVVLQHSEATRCDIDEIYDLLYSFEEIFVRDKKEFLHILPVKQLSDIYFISPTIVTGKLYSKS